MTSKSQRSSSRPIKNTSADHREGSIARSPDGVMTSPPGHVQMGVIGRPHGVRGEMTVWLHNPSSSLLSDELRSMAALSNEAVSLLVYAPEGEMFAEKILSVGNIRSGRKGARILRALNVNNRDEAAAFRGWRIFIPIESLPALNSEHEFYFHTIEGAPVVLASGLSLGRIRRVVETSCEVLEIERLDGTELLVPVLHDTVKSFGPPVVLFDRVIEWFDLHTPTDHDSVSKEDVAAGDER